jgi:predicted nucleotidyltransferase
VSVTTDPRVLGACDEHPYPLLFATVSGAHLYGFPSPDSDVDLRGVHLLPLEELVGLDTGRETVERTELRDGMEVDLVTHDARKFFALLLRRNGYVLEQLLSPLVVRTGPAHEELRALAAGCLTRHHSHHYLGFAATQWRLFAGHDPHPLKPLLYTYRVLLTGIHLMRTGEVVADLPALGRRHDLPWVAELVARKLAGPERGTLDGADLARHERRVGRLREELERAAATSHLPERPTARAALHGLLLRLRLGAAQPSSRGSGPGSKVG